MPSCIRQPEGTHVFNALVAKEIPLGIIDADMVQTEPELRLFGLSFLGCFEFTLVAAALPKAAVGTFGVATVKFLVFFQLLLIGF